MEVFRVTVYYAILTVLRYVLYNSTCSAVEVHLSTLPASDILENQRVTWICTFKRSNPNSTKAAIHEWSIIYKNDQEERVALFQDGSGAIESGYKERFQIDQSGNLITNVIERYDAGIYKCKVTIFDDYPLISTEELLINVLYVDKPLIYTLLDYIVAGNNIEIICNISDANPEPMLQIENNHHQAIASSNGSFLKYTIKETTKSDAGEYYCVAKNKAGSKNSESRMIDIYFLEIPVLNILRDVLTDNAYNIECQCSASVPVPQLYLIHNNVTIKNTTGLKLTYRLKTLTDKDEGVYQCIAESIAGDRESNIHRLYIPIDSRMDPTIATGDVNHKANINNKMIWLIFGVMVALTITISTGGLYNYKYRKRRKARGPHIEKIQQSECIYQSEETANNQPAIEEVKSTQALISNACLDSGVSSVYTTFNPTGTVGKEINETVIKTDKRRTNQNVEGLLYADLEFKTSQGESTTIKHTDENTVYSVIHCYAQGTG